MADTTERLGAATVDAVQRRALSLCWTAEPHYAISPPCTAHLAEARRALFDEWLRQESEV